MEKLEGGGGGDHYEGRHYAFEREITAKFDSGGIFPRHPPPQFDPHSRQSAKLFLKSSELGVPQPLTRRRVCPLGSGGGAHSLVREGLGESQFRLGDIHCGTLYLYVLCGLIPSKYLTRTLAWVSFLYFLNALTYVQLRRN
jgi:hypothetical protein